MFVIVCRSTRAEGLSGFAQHADLHTGLQVRGATRHDQISVAETAANRNAACPRGTYPHRYPMNFLSLGIVAPDMEVAFRAGHQR